MQLYRRYKSVGEETRLIPSTKIGNSTGVVIRSHDLCFYLKVNGFNIIVPFSIHCHLAWNWSLISSVNHASFFCASPYGQWTLIERVKIESDLSSAGQFFLNWWTCSKCLRRLYKDSRCYNQVRKSTLWRRVIIQDYLDILKCPLQNCFIGSTYILI